ncbi:MAG: hypothetical protein FWC78_06530 [Defluviitaleaceae bacterium]|nr:hypothetical protein [Defluviitaleaceae bacterium]
MKKLLITLCLVAVAFGGLPVSANTSVTLQSQYIPICPHWTNIFRGDAFLSFNSSGRATMSGHIIGQAGTERISVNAILSRINPNGTLTPVATWSNLTVMGSTWSWSHAHYVARGHQYRLTLSAAVARNGFSEAATFTSDAWAH